MKIIGLTGGVASGKTTVSDILSKLGAIIIDADKIARRVVQRGKPAYRDIVAYFGQEILLEDYGINRKKLAGLVFRDKDALEKLNSITHPRIIGEIKKEIKTYKQMPGNHVIIIDAALLIETNLKDMVQEIWLVLAPKEVQKLRLMDRDGISSGEADRIIKSQTSNEEKIPFADRLIDNSGDLEGLLAQVKDLWRIVS